MVKKQEQVKAEPTDQVKEPDDQPKNELLEAKPRDRSGDSGLKRFVHAYRTKKKLSIPVTLAVIVALVLAVPMTRYKVLGLFIQKSFSVTVLDSTTSKPVSGAVVNVGGKTGTTDGEGHVTLHEVTVGTQQLKVEKKYYETVSADVLVSLTDSKNTYQAKIKATGRQVPIAVANKISGKGIKGVKVSASGTQAETDDKGEAIIVLPADTAKQKVTLSRDGFNGASATIDVSEQLTPTNRLSLTPSGKIYFLSKRSGKIDVVKANLDGTERKVVFAGTGKEQDFDTTLLASRDWKYLAFKTRRDGVNPTLYLIETADDKVTTIDEGDANFVLSGWLNQTFVYKVVRNKKEWQPKREAIKAYNAQNKSLAVIQESAAEGTSSSNYKAQSFGSIYVLPDALVYTTIWNSSWMNDISGKKAEIIRVQPDGSGQKVLKSFPIPAGVTYAEVGSRAYSVDEIYFSYAGKKKTYYEYEDGAVKEAKDLSAEDFYEGPYLTYLRSPSGQATFWFEPRDGKNTLFLGNDAGKEGQEIARGSELVPYGWYTEDYLLVSKKDSELYIMAKEKGVKPLKVTDYHKSGFNGQGYGGGYGGF
jgi:hypothetical protein